MTRAAAIVSRLPVLLLLLVALVASRGISQGELHFYNDEMRHAFTGVFFRDLMVDLPLKQPMQYAQEYYAKYPATAVPHWPPLFHVVQGIFFLVFGISVWVSRLSVLCFALLAVYFWYRIAERYGPRYRAFLSGLLFASVPFVLLYERVTMLEVPGLALCLGAIYFWLKFLESERPRHLWILAAFTAAAFLTSQRAIFLVFLCVAHLLIERRFRLLKFWQVWAACGAVVAVVLPWYVLMARTLTLMSTRVIDTSFAYVTSQIHLAFYLQKLPLQLGPVLLALSLFGLGWALFRFPRRYRFFLLWVLCCYVSFTLISEKDPRHTMIWIPPLVYFALVAVEVLCVRPKWGQIAATGLTFVFLVQGLRSERPRVAGIEEVARYVLSLPESDIVYYQGDLNGNFIFFVRKYDPEKRHMVAREKQVVVTQILFDMRPVIKTPEEVLRFFQTWGIRYAVVDSEDFLPALDAANQALHSDRFEVVRTFALQSNVPSLANRKVTVYRYRGEIHRGVEPVVVPMMTIRSNIRADLSRLVGHPWPR